jgi:hypothetical protein
MDKYKECTSNPSFVESFTSALAARKGVAIPRHPEIDGAYVLLRLKPPSWRLKEFYEYMNSLSSCCHDDPRLAEEHRIETILRQKNVFFCLDRNLDREDVEFLLQNLVHVPFFGNLPSDFTGESLAKGELSKLVRRNDYINLANFIDNSRDAFRTHLGWVFHLFRGRLECFLASKFELSNDFSVTMVTDRVYPSLAPIVSVPLSPRSSHTPPSNEAVKECLKGAFGRDYLHQGDITSNFVDYVTEALGKDRDQYFASYLFLSQSSGVGKSRFMQTPMMTQDTAIFLVYINCREENTGYPEFDPASYDFVHYLMELKSGRDMARALYAFMSLVFERKISSRTMTISCCPKENLAHIR